MITQSFLGRLALGAALVTGSAAVASAQDSGPLLDALVRKGILTDQEAEDLRADLSRDYAANNVNATPAGRSTTRMQITGRLQTQYAGLDTDYSAGADASHVNHFLIRRALVGVRGEFGPAWAGQMVYDFAASRFDTAFLQWRDVPGITVDVGVRKVNLGYEERTSSGQIKTIERSAVTRYFIEADSLTGATRRRLGAGAQRVGIFYDHVLGEAKTGEVQAFYGAALTNPERATDIGSSTSAGTSATNDVALWFNGGLREKVSADTNWTAGFGMGYIPGLGRQTLPLGSDDLFVGTVYGEFTSGRFTLLGEVLGSKAENGADALAANNDSASWGFLVQPSFMLTEKFEVVSRYSYLDTDGRGVTAANGAIRSSPDRATGSVPFDVMHEGYLGATYYFLGHDLKLSAGLVYGKLQDPLTGTNDSLEAEVTGVRSQLQVQF
ncbi:MAG: OprO/OprP family phosphate-selective porin [Opitutaceae bacterium]|nr:OprO/OprP family phosphate-selective porin [Opitutaceae bacterium]